MTSDVLILQDASHEYMFAGIIDSICGGILLYNLFCLIMHLVRVRKLREAGRLIVQGHDKRDRKHKTITVNGKKLDSSMIMDQINANKRKLKKKEEASIEGQKKAAIAQSKAAKKEAKQEAVLQKKQTMKELQQARMQALQPEVLLDQIYALDDQLENELQIFYAKYDTRIRDDSVRAAVNEALIKSRAGSKKAKKAHAEQRKKKSDIKQQQLRMDRKKREQSLQNVKAHGDISLFD